MRVVHAHKCECGLHNCRVYATVQCCASAPQISCSRTPRYPTSRESVFYSLSPERLRFNVARGRLYSCAARVAQPHYFVRTPNVVASAWSAATRARASRPKDGVRPGSTSSARHWVSDHATANRRRQRSQRKVVDASTKGRRLLQRGQTA